jgi:hypothetical protein
MSNVLAPRSAWPDDFPDVVIHSELAIRNRHPAYDKAKAGDAEASIALVRDLLNSEAIALLRQAIGQQDAILAAVSAIEKTGFNAIPDAMEHEIGKQLGLRVDTGEIRQINKVAHTRATGWHRLVTPPLFGGEVKQGREYVLVDDHVGLGGTLANMRGYIEAGGGRVIAMTTLTESRAARKISATPETITMLRHGSVKGKFA